MRIASRTDNGRDLVRAYIDQRSEREPNDRDIPYLDSEIRRMIGLLKGRGVRVDDLEQAFTQAQAPAPTAE